VIELTAEGTDYVARGDFGEDEFQANWSVLRMVLEDAPTKLTRQKILEQWPTDYPAPKDITLYRWLESAVAQGLVLREGTGRRNNPFRFWLAGQEARWRADPLAMLLQKAERDQQFLLGGA
jgi:hypothetical protein